MGGHIAREFGPSLSSSVNFKDLLSMCTSDYTCAGDRNQRGPKQLRSLEANLLCFPEVGNESFSLSFPSPSPLISSVGEAAFDCLLRFRLKPCLQSQMQVKAYQLNTKGEDRKPCLVGLHLRVCSTQKTKFSFKKVRSLWGGGGGGGWGLSPSIRVTLTVPCSRGRIVI